MDSFHDYIPSQQAANVLKKLTPFFLVGPSGSGKDTVANELLKTGRFYKLVTYTTRAPRLNSGHLEIDGEDYHFIDQAAVATMTKQRQFIEVTTIHNHFYATGLSDFEEALVQHKIPITDLDVKGVEAFRQLSPNCLAVFLLPSSFNEMRRRLAKRYGESASEPELIERMKTSLFELEEVQKSDLYHVLINRDISETVKNVLHIIDSPQEVERSNSATTDLIQQLIRDINTYIQNV